MMEAQEVAMEAEAATDQILSHSQLQPIWSQQYDVIKQLLPYFNIQDLLTAAQVCKVWSGVAKGIRRKRWNLPFVITFSTMGVMSSEKIVFLPEEFPKVVEDLPQEEDKEPKPGPAPKSVEEKSGSAEESLEEQREERADIDGFVFHEHKMTLQDVILEGLKNFSESQFLILIGNVCWKSGHESEALRLNMIDKIPPSISCLRSLASGIMTTLSDGRGTIEMEWGDIPAVTCMAIPKVHGLRIKTFTLDTQTIADRNAKAKESPSKNREAYYREHCEEILNISPEDNVKGIMLFCATQARDKQTRIATVVHEYIQKNPGTAFAGGMMNSTMTSAPNEPNLICSGILICSDDERLDIRVGSTAMYDAGMTPKNEQQLLKFKQHGLDAEGRDSFAIMFACNGRGFNMHLTETLESGLFQKYYPNTPMIGAFTLGEYIHEFVPGQTEPIVVPKKPSKMTKSFTTAVVFVSWKLSQEILSSIPIPPVDP